MKGLNIFECLLGGFLLIFGSRLGGSCTSGHGLSGMAILRTRSIIACCAMFGSGILYSFIMNAST